MQAAKSIQVGYLEGREQERYFVLEGESGPRMRYQPEVLEILKGARAIDDLEVIGKTVHVTLKSDESWHDVENLVLTLLVIWAGWDEEDVAVLDLLETDTEPTIRGTGHIKTVNGHNKLLIRAVSA